MYSRTFILTIVAMSTLVECRWQSPILLRVDQINRRWSTDAGGKVLPLFYKFQQEISLTEYEFAESQDDRIRFQSSLSLFDIPRGGAEVEDKDIEINQNDDNDSVFLRKIRNVIRSVSKTTKNTSPLLHQSWVSLIQFLESATGIRLIPVASSTKKKKKGKSQSKSNHKQPDIVDNEKKSVTLKARKSPPEKKGTGSKGSTKESKGSGTASLQIKKDLKATNPNYRIQQELKKFILDPPEHLSVKTGKNIRIWIVTMQGIGIYKGETFRLRIQFPNQYPTVPPSVYFLPPNIPIHEHVYTNGDICLSLLGKDWRPTMTAQSVAHSILSILASASSKSLPMDNSRHAGNAPGQYQENWVYHDDNC
jgi:ubiquitin-conjugating enzyme E2 W